MADRPERARRRLTSSSPATVRPSSRRRRSSASPPEAIVRTGWNLLSTTYRPPGRKLDCFLHSDAEYRAWLRPILELGSPGMPVLDLGCGTGEPASQELAKRFEVTGVDLSDVMIRRARRTVPYGRFVRADMSEVDFPPRSFGAIVSLYAIIHVPLANQRPLLARIHTWLRPRGLFLAVLGHDAYEGTVRGWLGSRATMFWSHADAAAYRRWFQEIGFTVLRQEFIPEEDGGHELFLARKPARSSSGARRRDPGHRVRSTRTTGGEGWNELTGYGPGRRSRARRPAS